MNKIISNRHKTVALNCLSIANALFHALTRLYRAQQMKEAEREKGLGVPAKQEVK